MREDGGSEVLSSLSLLFPSSSRPKRTFFRDSLQVLWPKAWITIYDLKNVGMPEYKWARKRTTSESETSVEKKVKDAKSKPKTTPQPGKSGVGGGGGGGKQTGSPKKTTPKGDSSAKRSASSQSAGAPAPPSGL